MISPKMISRFFIFWSVLVSVNAATAQEQYNILWITVEDMGPRLGCYGDGVAVTPNVDRLAAEGERYTNAYATYGVCAPSRHTLITGMYPTSTGAMAMRTLKRTSSIDQIKDPELLNIPIYEATPPLGVKCFSEYLRAKGYYCTNNQKEDYQFIAPVMAWDESGKEAHWRNRPHKEKPFFAVFNNTVTHESGVFKRRSPALMDRKAVPIPPYYSDTDTVREALGRHYDNIRAMDVWVGNILDQLEEDGLLEKTIIFFFSDHGDGLPRSKRWVYDSGIKVPLIIRYPNKEKGGTINGDLVSFVDFAPTVLKLAGREPPGYMQGRSFMDTGNGNPRKYIYAFRDRMDPAPETIRAVRDKRFKYIRNYRPDLPYIGFIPYRDRAPIMQELLQLHTEGGLNEDQWQFWAAHKPLEELYDLEADPHEIHNLAANPRFYEKLTELRGAHEAFTEKYGDLGMMPETELIKHLWPPEGVQPTTGAPVISRNEKTIQISCATEGASIAYRFSEEEPWKLYVEPFEVAQKNKRIEAVAHRLGWKPSRTAVYP